jgi:beta-phosphoglucomutase-like phosphatase (HAD superfamily)
MQRIQAILFEPVGCLAEFPAEPFHEIAARLFDVPKKKPSRSASRAYWHLLNLMELGGTDSIDALEMEAADATNLYEDVFPALTELKQMGIRLSVASSLGQAAIAHFLEKHNLSPLFDAVWSRDRSGGIKSIPIRQAAAGSHEAIFLADTLEGIKAAQTAGVEPILMMNNPDEARHLAVHGPAGGIVSLHELPDFVRLLLSRSLSEPRPLLSEPRP